MLLKDLSVEQIFAGVIGAATGVPAFWLYISRIVSKSAAENNAKVMYEITAGVMERLSGEVDRLNKSNSELSLSLELYRIENAELKKEISTLHETINTLTIRLNDLSRGN
jgi:predicted RNase H-like nuclease (RuvC/YqgF family)